MDHLHNGVKYVKVNSGVSTVMSDTVDEAVGHIRIVSMAGAPISQKLDQTHA